MIKIPLSQNKFALIDDEDLGVVSLFKWCVRKRDNILYAHTWINLNGKDTSLKMHRLIMNAKPDKDLDHKDGDGLNNQKHNLRFCTVAQNAMNKFGNKNSSSQYKGVSWSKRNKNWVASIQTNHKSIYLGSFKSEIEAAQAYDTKAIELFGEFAKINLEQCPECPDIKEEV